MKVRGARAEGPSAWMVVPALVFFVTFAVVPLLGVLFLSFTHWNGLGAITWAGLESWRTALTDSVTLNALIVTVKIMVYSLVVQVPISLLLGVFTAGNQRYRAVLAVLYFVPLLLSSAAVAIAFKALLDPNFGMGPGLHIPVLAQNWLGSADLVLFVVIFVIAWQFVPFHTLIYQGGVRQIPASFYEAAQIDGAGRIQQFFHITLPQLKYTIITSSTLMVLGSLAYFDLIFVLTAGGPGYATRLLPLHMYLTGFRANDMGAASALGVILVVIGLGLALVLQRLGGNSRSASQLEGA
ncbi:carbohydrate ABC transporter permease [Arthrobacter burdickii]|uniref:Sugar ABC transporter permease n=1 Tax=Arthrobacter burdickii TaxID=3035920 RepID=A0ABT8JWD9_9MICC|nr:sugar ABC transporter permease [Arthrobacter burdickii]MDN4609486.1 sugar ABC transporter permease [Arthrobacter burdickii]